MRLFSKKKSPGWFALRNSENGTCVAHVINSEAKPTVEYIAIQRGSLKDDSSVKTLTTNLSMANLHCSLLLAQNEYQLFQIEKPNVPANELKQAISWKLKDMIDYPVDQATIDVIDIPADPNNANRQSYVYAVAAKNSVIGDYMTRLIDYAGSGLEVIDIPELAQRNIAAYLEQEGRGLAMLSINSHGGLLTFTSGGELYHSRRIEIDTKQIQDDNSELKSSVFERLLLEIQRSLDNFERQFPYITINRLVLAPFMGREDFYDYLKAYLYIPIDRFDLSDVFEFKDQASLGDLSMQASLMPALGAALRGASSS
ncbi:agglutinin biogenesis protein MshI [Methylotenera sp.]|uniref:type IV pilus biogenesis protein PilM n=1 Tax=Methylotenera sp. TaxID=2051956 RepID=UPI00248986A3|nr:agglutinin biogenesis protein MshI [Methylotenera sp.]MDI1299660.1 agglutinin biogenesis protein MshI [Methylotenera sp.]